MFFSTVLSYKKVLYISTVYKICSMFQEEYSAESLRDTLDKMADGGEQLGALTGCKLATMTEDQLIATEEKQVTIRSKDQLNTQREDQLTNSKKDQLTTRKKDQLTTSKKDQLTTRKKDQLTTSKKDPLTNISPDQLTTTWKGLWRKAIAGKNSLPIYNSFLIFSGTERKLKSLCFRLQLLQFQVHNQ
jgi:hypothetical protein